MSARIWSNLQQRKSRPTNTKTTAANRGEELMVIAARNGWTPRSSLTMSDINRMGALEFRYHELFSPNAVAAALKATDREAAQAFSERPTLTYEQIERMSASEAHATMLRDPIGWKAAFDEEERRRQSKKHVAKTKVELMWSGYATPEEDEAAIQAAQNFTKKTPQFERSIENIQKVIDHMRERNYDGTDEGSYVRAFRELLDAGQIAVKPSESADEFLKNHPELLPKAVSPFVASQQAKVKATEEHFAATKAATAQAGSTRVTAYPAEQRGVPPLSEIEKISLRNLVRSMTADELASKCATDPSFKRCLDSL